MTSLSRRIRDSYERHSRLISSLGIVAWLTFEAQIRSDRVAQRMGHRLRTKTSRYPLEYRAGESDLEVFNQIFIHREYDSIREITRGGLIVDCGANVGYSTAWFLSRFPESHVIAVEPDAGNFALLRSNLAPFGSSSVTAVHGAVWSKECGLAFDDVPFRDGLSWSVRVREAGADETAAVRAFDIPALMQMRNARRIALLKVDIERAEIEVFGPSSRSWIPLCDTIVIELHDAECEKVFFSAIDGEGFSVSRAGELTICTRT